MGTVIDLPAEAGGWTLEVRGESIFLSVSTWVGQHVLDEPSPEGLFARTRDGRSSFKLPMSEVPAMVAVLSTAIAHPAIAGIGNGPRSWTVELDRPTNEVIVEGPIYTYGVAEEFQPVGVIELAYVSPRELRDKITEAAAEAQ